jgi:hypothetical protein
MERDAGNVISSTALGNIFTLTQRLKRGKEKTPEIFSLPFVFE